jgi:hypothetical protein
LYIITNYGMNNSNNTNNIIRDVYCNCWYTSKGRKVLNRTSLLYRKLINKNNEKTFSIHIEQLSAVIFLDRFHLSFFFSYFFVTLYSIWVASLLLLELLMNISGCHYWSSWTLVSIKITMYFLYVENRFLWVMKLVSEFWFGGALHMWKDFLSFRHIERFSYMFKR